MNPTTEDLISLLNSIALTQAQTIERLKAIETRLQGLSIKRTPKIAPLKDAWKVLGYKDYSACWRNVGGLYRIGHEVIDRRKPGSVNPLWYLDIEKCIERERTTSEERIS